MGLGGDFIGLGAPWAGSALWGLGELYELRAP